LTRFNVSRTGAPTVDLIADLEQGQFLDRLRREARDKDAPASLKRAVSQLENALFALTQPGAGRPTIQRALILLGETMQILGVSRKGRDAVPVPQRLSTAWVLQAADDSAEFRIALALASLSGLRPYLAPVARDKGRWQWAPESRLHVWGKGDLVRNLVRVVERRVIEAQRNPELQPFNGNARLGARLSDIQAFLNRQTDDGLIAALLHGLVWAESPDSLLPSHAGGEGTTIALPAAYSICKPCFTPPDLLKFLGRLPQDASFILPGELPRLLAAGQAEKALPLAWKRGRIAGLGWPRGEAPHPPALDGPRLLAALAVPIQSSALLYLLPRIEEPQPV
jgi:CRISPR-associated protein Csx17